MLVQIDKFGGRTVRGIALVDGLPAARRRSGFARPGWLAAIACAVILAGLFGLKARPSKGAVREGPVDPNTPEEREYRRLLRSHMSARNEVDYWIRTDIAARKSLAPPPNAFMKSRIKQRFEPLIATYQDFIKRNPGHVRAGQSYHALLDDLNAEGGLLKHWEESRGIDTRDPDAWRRLANYYNHIGEIQKAFQCFAQAIELDPTEPVYYQEYALTVFLYRRDAREHFHFNEQQVFDLALELYEKALQLDPKNAPLALEIAQCYYIIRPPRVEPALQAWRRLLKLASTDRQRENICLNLARIEIAGEDFDSARRYLTLVKNRQFERVKAQVAKTLTEREKMTAKTAATATKGGTSFD